ncbi:hypothetical protein [Coraliomargarita akajimensis]|uniref:Lipoprotein n=1 Tax=Coraliomargarita akajimensis (strain DSM 45221 / IAM 15411 / JCM 23193 / KCTC 12865 / 04OKA010-24) TaxID=583355 RepID=D5EMD0_CORAD|nr:hypothetical protein [Coraliomargarita akajimensis]ADE53336.1 conserved hypothetical protein [Coraliomargarita akajimensis DSM 45221]
MKLHTIIQLSALLLIALAGCAKESEETLDGGYYFFDLQTKETPELSLWVDQKKFTPLSIFPYRQL